MHFLAATVMDLLGKQKYIIANFHVQNFSDLEKKKPILAKSNKTKQIYHLSHIVFKLYIIEIINYYINNY